jgi:outer membrane protein assembly factor BamA
VWAKAERIQEILVTGNEKTESSAIIASSELMIDEEITQAVINDATDKLGSNPIFESVNISQLPGSDPMHLIIKITVKEKISWFVVPTFSLSEGSRSGGATYIEGNLFGRFKKALVFADYGNQARHVVVAYRDPEFFSPTFVFAIDGIYRWDKMKEYNRRKEVREVLMIERGTTILPGVQWNPHFSSSLGGYYRRITHRLKSSDPNLRTVDLTNGNDIALLLKFNYTNSKSYEGLAEGPALELESQLSDNRFFSDYNYFRQILRFSMGFGFFDHKLNISSNASVQLGRDLPYYYELMLGGDNLRGYLNREFRGDTKYTYQQEIMAPVYNFNRFILRQVTFWDSGILYFKNREFSRAAWNNGIGAGLRLYLKGIAIPLVGYDFGYAFEDKEYATYLTVGATF